jgi:hypothetical protein
MITVNEQIEIWTKRLRKVRKQWQKMEVLAAAQTRVDTIFECDQLDQKKRDVLSDWIAAERAKIKPKREARLVKAAAQAAEKEKATPPDPAPPGTPPAKKKGILESFAW